MLFQKKYKIVFIRKHFNALFVVRIFQMNKLNDLFSFETRTFKVDLANPTYILKEQKVYFFNIDSGTQLTFVENASQLNPKELDMIVGQKIIKELTSGVLDNQKEKMMLIGLGMLLGGLIIAVILMYVYNDKINTLLTEQAEQTNEPVVIVQSIALNFWRFLKYRLIR